MGWYLGVVVARLFVLSGFHSRRGYRITAAAADALGSHRSMEGGGGSGTLEVEVPCWPSNGQEQATAATCCRSKPRDVVELAIGPRGEIAVGAAEFACFDHVVKREDCCRSDKSWRNSFKVRLPYVGDEQPVDWKLEEGASHLSHTPSQLEWERRMRSVSRQRRVDLRDGTSVTVWNYNRAPADPDWGTWTQLRRAMDAGLHSGSSTVFDVGGNIGVVAVAACKRCPRCTIYTMEPFVTNYRYLLWNLRTNNCTQNVRALNIAVGASGNRKLRYNPTCPNQSGAPPEASRGCNVALINQPVREVPLASVAQFFNVTARAQQALLVKMDCEGCEHTLPAQDHALLRRSAAVVAELHEDSRARKSGEQLCTGSGMRDVRIYIAGRGEVNVCKPGAW